MMHDQAEGMRGGGGREGAVLKVTVIIISKTYLMPGRVLTDRPRQDF